ncbi:MAG: DUF4330 family protein [Clostridia bacterium]|nr:DUF4330 family protein [Clostridia bacterium]
MSKKQNSQKKISFSVIDFAVIVIVLALFVGVIARYDVVDRLFSKTSLVDAKVTFVAEAITNEEAAAFTENSMFYTSGELFGTLTAVTDPVKALMYRETSSGELVAYEHDSLIDLRGSFTSKVMESKNGYLLGGNRYIAAGSVFTVRAEGVAVKITIISVETLN